MTTAPLDLLLERIRDGDVAAAEQLVAEYEPYLRATVRRGLPDRLRPKFDSADVVQSVWVRILPALRGGARAIADGARLRALLRTVARRSLVSRFRHHRHALDHEQPAADVGLLPEPRLSRPSEAARANELWEQLLELSPPSHHDLLRLRRQGLGLNEIAARIGMHEGSVRRALRRLSRELALRQEPLNYPDSTPTVETSP